MVFKRKFVRLKPMGKIISTVFLGSLLITMVQSQTTMDPSIMTELVTDIIKTTDTAPTSVTSSSILARLTSLAGGSTTEASIGSTINPSMPSSSNLPTTLIPSSTSAILSTIPDSATATSETKSASPEDQRTIPDKMTTIFQASTDRTSTESVVLSTEVLTSEQRTTSSSQITTLIDQPTSKMGTTSGSGITTSGRQTSELVTITPAETSLYRTTAVTSSKPSDAVTTKDKTSPTEDGTTYQTPSKPATVKITQTTKRVVSSTEAILPKKTTQPSLPLKTMTDTKPTTDIQGTVSSSSAREPLLTIPQWFAVFLGTFLTIFLIFLTNIWYKAKMTPDTEKPSIELIKHGEKNDRPKSWQENNVPLDFMSLHIELPKETKFEMKCAENLAFEGDQPNSPGTSVNNPAFEVVTLTKL